MSQILSEEQLFFIDVLRNYIHEEPTEIKASFDWNLIKLYADHHQVTAIFYKQTKQLIFQKAYASQVYRYTNYKQVINSFKEAIKRFPFIIVKGSIIAELYPVPALRSMGDVDVLIHLENRENVHKALLGADFKYLGEGGPGEWKYSNNGYLFEVHDSLVHRYEGKENLIEYFSNVWDYVKNEELDWSFHLIYLLEHLRQHFVGEGVGFRQFIDVAMVSMKCEINWGFVKTELKKIGLYNFARTVFSFINKWFDIAVPLEISELEENFYIVATKNIFENGVFGFNNEENKGNKIAFQMHYRDVDYETARKTYIMQKIFPNYKIMQTLPYCSYVRKNIVFLPVAWIHRLVYRLINTNGRDNIKQQLSSDKVTARMEMLHQWGL